MKAATIWRIVSAVVCGGFAVLWFFGAAYSLFYWVDSTTPLYVGAYTAATYIQGVCGILSIGIGVISDVGLRINASLRELIDSRDPSAEAEIDDAEEVRDSPATRPAGQRKLATQKPVWFLGKGAARS